MKLLSKTVFYGRSDYLFKIVTIDQVKPSQGVYVEQKSIRCHICKKIDKTAHTNSTYCYLLKVEILVDGDKWVYVPLLHEKCTEIAKMGLLL